MKVLKIAGGTLIGLLVILLLVGLFLPKEFSLQRSTVIDAPAAVVFEQVNNLEKNQAWMPWNKLDPTMKVTFGDVTVGEGASYSWTSDKSGDGTLTIKESVPNERIVNDLDFGEGGPSEGRWTFEETGGGTKVTWAMVGAADGIIDRYFGLMVEKMAGPAFEQGLADLKKVSEEAAANVPEDTPDDMAEDASDGTKSDDMTQEPEAGQPG